MRTGLPSAVVVSLRVNGLGIARVFTNSNVGALTLTPEAYATNAWYGSNDFEQTFLTARGVA
jgi:hypothetical protein